LALKAQDAGRPVAETVELPGHRFLSVEVIPLQSQGARERQTLFVMRDETARLATERMRRDFATNASHELKTPLAGLSLLAETLKHAITEDPEQATVFVDRLAAEIGRLTNLTNDLLALSQLEEPAGQTAGGLTRVDAGRLAAETAAEMMPLAKAKDHELLVDVASDAWVMGDDVALRTLVRNLLDNAIRYTEPGGRIGLTVTTRDSAAGSRSVVIAVEDNGVGIPVAEQTRVFERFYRVDKARSRQTGGTGLGLSIVRHVAERHGGRVDLVSTLGSGSTFTVELPAAV
jgi:two-component system sensor histidine kinase SenX3